jgi:pentatricopeptide repeat protein
MELNSAVSSYVAREQAAEMAASLAKKTALVERLQKEDLSQRVRKRVHAALSALKKQIELMESAAAAATARVKDARALKKQKLKQRKMSMTGSVGTAAAAAAAAAASAAPAASPAASASATAPAGGGGGSGGLNRSERKRRLISLNEDLAWCAKRKKLKRARELFDSAREQGLAPDAHSWTNLVNCLARCGRPDEAAHAVRQMRESGVSPNVVTYTTLVKALCDAGDVESGALVVLEAEESGAANARTYNALLRGCVRVGAVGLGQQTIQRWWSRAGGDPPDSAAIEAGGHLLGQALRPKAIASLVSQADEASVPITPAARASTHLAAARAFALLGKPRSAMAQLGLLHDALATPDPPVIQREGSSHIEASSIELFARHRRAELALDAATVAAFVERGKAADVLGALTQRVISFVDTPRAAHARFEGHGDGNDDDDGYGDGGGGGGGGSARGSHGSADGDGADAIGCRLAHNLWDSFGLGACSRRAGLARPRLEAILARRLDCNGHLHRLSSPSQRLVLEICAGAGEWICVQAKESPSTQFVAVELRVDRGFHIFARTLFEGTPNVSVVVGDAREIVTCRLAASSVHAVCINHPEPPEWAGGTDDSDGSNLLDEKFLRACCALLVPGGTLAIVTDNKRYGRSLAEAVGAIEGLRDVSDATAPPTVKVGLPAANCGYAVSEASSFFDRLWANGKKKTRYYLAAAKLPEGGASVGGSPAGAADGSVASAATAATTATAACAATAATAAAPSPPPKGKRNAAAKRKRAVVDVGPKADVGPEADVGWNGSGLALPRARIHSVEVGPEAGAWEEEETEPAAAPLAKMKKKAKYGIP